MFVIKFGNLSIHLWPILLIVTVSILCVMIRYLWLMMQNRRLVQLCQSAQYEESILIATKLMNYYQNVYKLSKTKTVKNTIDILNMYLAIAYYGLSNHSLFLKHINLINDTNIEKHFWIALFSLLENNDSEFQKHYNILLTKGPSNSLLYVNAIKSYKDGKKTEAIEIMDGIYPKINFTLLKDIAQKIRDN